MTKSTAQNSKRIRALVVDAIFSVVTLILTRYLSSSPDDLKFALGIVGAVQPVFIAAIASFNADEARYAKLAEVQPHDPV